MVIITVSILPSLHGLALVGHIICGVGAVLHVIAGIGYLRALTED